MDRYRCPAAQENLQAHGKFVEVVAGFTRRHEASGFDLATAGQLADIVDDWLSGHICHVDVQLKHSVERA
jgi:hemerythrin